jgi:mannose-6-phosphate isomerase-like protein (cupin superfamily)
MIKHLLLGAVLIGVASGFAEAQRRGGALVTFAVTVSDPDGKPIPGVLVTVEGPASRSVRTEGGRIALENLPAGNYRLRFEHEAFITLERELTARGAAPIDLKVTLTPAPERPAPPPPPAEPERPVVNARPAIVDVPGLVEKEWVGRGPSKTTRLSCGTDGAVLVMQLTEALMPHDHAESDEVFYVIAGEGRALVGDASHQVKAGMYVFVPRGTRHGLGPAGKNPLIVLSSRPGERCQ